MIRQQGQSKTDEHNRSQRSYFERSTKRTMVPRDSRYLRRHVEQALSSANISAGQRVLEVGCGMGRYTLILARLGIRVEGLDLSPILLDRLRAFNSGRYDIPLHCTDIEHCPAELDGKFDAVLGFFTLHHLHDLSTCFEALTRVLKVGGRLAFVEPNPLNPLYYIQVTITPGMTWRGESGLTKMRPAPVLSAMSRAGLGNLVVRRFGLFPPFLANQRWGAMLEARLEAIPGLRPFLPFQLFKGERLVSQSPTEER